MLKNLSLQSDFVSMESSAGDAGLQKATGRLPDYLVKVSHFLNENIVKPITAFAAGKDLGWLALNANRYSYPEWRSFRMEAPHGFQGSLAEYGKDLVTATTLMQKLESDVLAPYMTFVAERLSDPTSMKSLSTTIKVPGMHDVDYARVAKKLESYFPDKKVSEEPVYSDVIRRQADWIDINNSVQHLAAMYNDGHYEAVVKRTRELGELVNVLADRLTHNKEEFIASPVIVNALSKLTLAVAQQVEFYGVLRSRVSEYQESIEASLKQVRNQAGI